MITLFSDLDNTIIYSYKHDIGAMKRSVEVYHGREISFITENTYRLLKDIKDKMLIIPTSTRTIEQYNRIQLGVGDFKYALVCNGGGLLVDGVRDENWYSDSLRSVSESKDELEFAMSLLYRDKRRTFDLRFIENLFLFTKCDNPEKVVEDLKRKLDIKKVEVFHNGTKVYVVPVNLSKGNAIKRFGNYMKSDRSIAAGDSAFDISMLKAADIGMAPYGFKDSFLVDFDVMEPKEECIFSDFFLGECKKLSEA